MGLPAMSMNRVPGVASVTETSSPAPSRTSWEVSPPPVRPEASLAVQQVGEALKLRWHRRRQLPAGGQLDIQDQRGRPQLHGRPLADQDPDGRVTPLSHRDLRWQQDLGNRLHRLSLRARFTQNSTLRHSVSPRPWPRSSAPIASACQAPRPVLSASSAPWGALPARWRRRVRVLWPVLAEPSRMYHRLSNPRWGCLVSMPDSSESRKRLSCTRMKGSVSS